jgi:integrase family protein with SAM-like domain
MGEVDVTDAVGHVLAALRAAGRTERTIRCHQVVLERFSGFLAGRRLGTVSERVCIDLVENQTGVRLGSLREPVNDRDVKAVRRPVVLVAEVLAGQAIEVDRSVIPVKDGCPARFRPVRDDYVDCCRERGNAEATVVAKDKAASRLLAYLQDVGVDDLAALGVRDVSGFLLRLRGLGLGRKTIASMRSCVADFLRFLEASGRTPCGLADRMPPHRHVRHESEPHLWTADEIRRVLAVIDRQSACGKRDYAMLLTTARLGLRISDLRQSGTGRPGLAGQDDHDRAAQDRPPVEPAAAGRCRLGDHRLRPRRPPGDGLPEGVHQASPPVRRVRERFVGRVPALAARCPGGHRVRAGRAGRDALAAWRAGCRDDRQRDADTGGVGGGRARVERHHAGVLPAVRR